MRIKQYLATALVFALASVGRAESPTLTAIPASHTLYARADTLAALEESTKPTVVYNGSEFLWTARAADGTRHFTHATAYLLRHQTGKTEYVLLNPSTTADGFRARFSVPTTTNDANADPGEASTATILSQHKTYGTLYQIRLDRALTGRIDEERILVMHSPARGWRLVDAFRADYKSSDSAIRTRVTTAVTWNASPERPLTLNYQAVSAYRVEGETYKTPLVVHETFTKTGILPLAAATSRGRYVVVGKGDTLNDILSQLTDVHVRLAKPGVSFPDDFREMKRAVLALNPGLDPNVIRLNARLNVPSVSAPLGVAKAKAVAKAGPVTKAVSPVAPTVVAADYPH